MSYIIFRYHKGTDKVVPQISVVLALSISAAVTQACLDGDPAVRQQLAACALKRALHVSVAAGVAADRNTEC